ncbi:hypothetical protein M404DRAFT_157222 [Pisolithus tinctorius Marx 270]|uniref:Uncharacterized protein n=1 Tax=Pisolithus tinctorius Marx 270 TaxID=870435 RepID=A0A0C3JM98_PISTI|nr:hypothetical protein M404DRAFT_157222 [Pisolithus tinctorius Marx 270]
MESIYLAGIIPVPQEPLYDQLNHVLHLLVNNLVQSWSPGLCLAHMAVNTFGCLVQCAVIPLVCNLLATCKTAGFSGLGTSGGKFCLFCLQDGTDIRNTNISSSQCHTWQEHLTIAMMWRDAESEGAHNKIYTQFGICCSELLQLPYWNPIQFTVVNCMHNFFAGDLQHHC